MDDLRVNTFTVDVCSLGLCYQIYIFIGHDYGIWLKKKKSALESSNKGSNFSLIYSGNFWTLARDGIYHLLFTLSALVKPRAYQQMKILHDRDAAGVINYVLSTQVMF
ncbi:hypothetical protein RJT34_28470 [Clitoria ternatea]|uniref:Uncharacterized protein n=1 Tax=Clitoria ternatea TaxID=43366 RepID=A0AAN9FE31_CLITE